MGAVADSEVPGLDVSHVTGSAPPWGFGSRVEGSGLRALRVEGFGFRIEGFQGCGLRVSG
jgi:hypothetical protein